MTDYAKDDNQPRKTLLIKGKQQLVYLQSAFVNVVKNPKTKEEEPSFNITARHSRQDKVNPNYAGSYITENENRVGKINHMQNIGRGDIGTANFNRMLDANGIDHPTTSAEWLEWAKKNPKTPFVNFGDKKQKAVAFEATIFRPDNGQQGAIITKDSNGRPYQKPVLAINPRTISIVGNSGSGNTFDADKERELNDAAKTKTAPAKAKTATKAKAKTADVDVPDL